MCYLYFLILLIIFACCANGQRIDDSKNYVVDRSMVLSNEQVDKLNFELRELEDSIGSQMYILIIDSLGEETIEAYSLRTATEWGIGRKDVNDGVLVTLAMFEREIRIEVGIGLEKIIKDEIAAKIIREDMAPNFKEEKYYEGLLIGIIQIKTLIYENSGLIGQSPY